MVSAPEISRWAGPIIDVLLDYVGNVQLCSRLKEHIDSYEDWAVIKEKAGMVTQKRIWHKHSHCWIQNVSHHLFPLTVSILSTEKPCRFLTRPLQNHTVSIYPLNSVGFPYWDWITFFSQVLGTRNCWSTLTLWCWIYHRYRSGPLEISCQSRKAHLSAPVMQADQGKWIRWPPPQQASRHQWLSQNIQKIQRLSQILSELVVQHEDELGMYCIYFQWWGWVLWSILLKSS